MVRPWPDRPDRRLRPWLVMLVSVTTWLAAAKLERLVLSQIVRCEHSHWKACSSRTRQFSLQFSSCAVNEPSVAAVPDCTWRLYRYSASQVSRATQGFNLEMFAVLRLGHLHAWKCIHGVAAVYLQELCTLVDNIRGRPRLRSASTGCFRLPWAQAYVAQRSYAYNGPAVWNSLPA